MSFMDHLETLRWHIVRSVIAIFAVAVVLFLNPAFIFDKIILAPKTKRANELPSDFPRNRITIMTALNTNLVSPATEPELKKNSRDMPELYLLCIPADFLYHVKPKCYAPSGRLK